MTRLLCLSLVASFLLARVSAQDASYCSLESQLVEHAEGELGFSIYTEQDNQQLHLSCYAVGTPKGENYSAVVQKVVSEFQRGQVGVSSFQADNDAPYPCDNQNSWGQMNIEVMEVNGANPYDEGAASIRPSADSTATCQLDESRAFYNSSVHIVQEVNAHLSIDTYAFRNKAAQDAANLQHTMTIGTMDACKMELLYRFVPKAGGGLDARVQVRMHAFGGLEQAVNDALVSETHEATNSLSISAPKPILDAGAGMGPGGCGSLPESSSGESLDMHKLIEVSLSFTCANTGVVVSAPPLWSGVGVNSLFVSLTPEQAPESCGFMYWDPLVTPTASLGRAGPRLTSDGGDHVRKKNKLPHRLLKKAQESLCIAVV